MTGRKTKAFSALCLALALTGCRRPAPQQTFERPPAPVAVVTALSKDVPVYLDEIGTCAAREVVAVQPPPQVSGRITAIHFEDGADIKKGDLLFTIDQRPYQALVDAAAATVAQQQAALDWRQVEFKRVETLTGTGIVPQTEIDTKQNAMRVADAELQQAKAALETAKINLEYCLIRSPIDGRAGRRLVDVGNVVAMNMNPGATGTANGSSGPGGGGGGGSAGMPLLVIQRLDPIYADFTVTEGELTTVQRHMARGTLKAEVRVPEEPAAPIAGELTFVDNAIQEGTGTVKLRATAPNADHRLWPGRFVRVRLVLESIPNAVLIPVAATQVSAKGTFVYVVKDDSTAEMRLIRAGQRQDDMLVIEDGVKAGERVVISGQLGVTPGGKVRVDEPAPSPTAAAGGGGGGR